MAPSKLSMCCSNPSAARIASTAASSPERRSEMRTSSEAFWLPSAGAVPTFAPAQVECAAGRLHGNRQLLRESNPDVLINHTVASRHFVVVFDDKISDSGA